MRVAGLGMLVGYQGMVTETVWNQRPRVHGVAEHGEYRRVAQNILLSI